MASLNRCEFIGNLGKDPQVRTIDNGKKVANFSIACTESWKKDGEKVEKTEWINVTIWGPLADIAEKYLHKGSKVYIAGKMQTRKYEKDGIEKYATEIVLQGFDSTMIMLDGKQGGIDRAAPGTSEARSEEMRDDEIPF